MSGVSKRHRTLPDRASLWRAAHPERRWAIEKAWRERSGSKYKENSKRWRKNNREKTGLYARNARLKAYGVSPEQYSDMLVSQDGVCAICRRPESAKYREKIRALAVDHNHESKQVRGLLCSLCNRMIGMAGENVQVLLNAVEYLRKFNKTEKK